MKKLTVLARKNEYTLIYRHTIYEPFVVAWKYDAERQDWCQGNYFESVVDAKSWMENLAS